MISLPKAVVNNILDEETPSNTALLVTGGDDDDDDDDSSIKLWSITLIDDSSSQLLGVKVSLLCMIKHAHYMWVDSLCFLEDGRLVSSGEDSMKVWDFKRLLNDCSTLDDYIENSNSNYYLISEENLGESVSITKLQSDSRLIVCVGRHSIDVWDVEREMILRELECFYCGGAFELEPGVLLCLKDGELHFWCIGDKGLDSRYICAEEKRLRKSSMSYRLKNGGVIDKVLRLKNGNILIRTGNYCLALKYYSR